MNIAYHKTGNASGFSLIELMIVIVLGLMITAVVASIFVTGNKNYKQDDRYARMQENGRFAMNLVTQDLSMAGFWGYLAENTNAVTTLGTTCGVTFNLQNPIGLVNSPTTTAANSTHSCITSSTFVANTDVLTVKRVTGRPETSLTDGNAYLRVDGNNGVLFWRTGGSPAYDSTKSYWRYQGHIYYIANKTAYGVTVPTLYRKSITGPTLGTTSEELIEGIENMQVQFGIDSDTTPDGVPNYFTSSPTTAELSKAVVARISVLARALTPDPDTSYSNTSSYNLGESTVGPFNDRYQRIIFTSTAALRNINYAARNTNRR